MLLYFLLTFYSYSKYILSKYQTIEKDNVISEAWTTEMRKTEKRKTGTILLNRMLFEGKVVRFTLVIGEFCDVERHVRVWVEMPSI